MNGAQAINELVISNAAYLSCWQGSSQIKLPCDAETFEQTLGLKIKNEKSNRIKSQNKNTPNSSRWKVNW